MAFSKTLDLDDFLVNRLPSLKIKPYHSTKSIWLKVRSVSNGIVLFNQTKSSEIQDFFIHVNNIHTKLSEELGVIQNFEDFYKSLKDCSIEQDLNNYQHIF